MTTKITEPLMLAVYGKRKQQKTTFKSVWVKAEVCHCAQISMHNRWDNGSTMGLDLNLAEQLKPIPFLGKQSNHYSAMLDTRGKHLLYGQKQKIL